MIAHTILLEVGPITYLVQATYCQDDTWYAEGWLGGPECYRRMEEWFGVGNTIELALQGLRQAIKHNPWEETL